MQAFLLDALYPIRTVIACWFLAAGIGGLHASPAHAHGEAQWIMDNYRYVDRFGAHCCGPSDCRRENAVNFREAREGVYFSTGAGREILMHRSLRGRGLYVSKDRDWWLCIRDGEPRCIFAPAKGR